MQRKMTIEDVDLKGKRTFVRVDFNVPLDDKRQVADDTRIRASLKTVRFAVEAGAKVILASHLGRPKGKDPKESLKPAADRLSALTKKTVVMAPDSVGPEVEALVAKLGDGDLCMLENVRFHGGETKNDPALARQYAALADVFVNDAFGSAHRAHASTEGIARFVRPSVAGFLMEEELSALGKLLVGPERPFVAMLGGAKISDKIPVLENLIGRIDALLVGGAMANTFLAAQGKNVGISLVEPDMFDAAKKLLRDASSRGVRVLLPVDAVVARETAPGAASRTVDVEAIPADWNMLDIGPRTVEAFGAVIGGARTLFWNGPMGRFETPPFDRGTTAVARLVVGSGAYSVVGGGDSVSAVNQSGVADRIIHMSTGGGASLEFLSGIELPGVAALNDK